MFAKNNLVRIIVRVKVQEKMNKMKVHFHLIHFLLYLKSLSYFKTTIGWSEEKFEEKMVRSTSVGNVEKWDMRNWQREQVSRTWRGNGGEEDEIAMRDCIQSDLERARKE